MNDFWTGFFYGVICIFIALVITAQFITNPFMIDCGCGAMSSMCGQCIKGGNLSEPICSYFVNNLGV